MTNTDYVVQRDGGYYVAGPIRVSLDSIVHGFNDGESPETIQANFPALKLSQIYGAIAFYLDNQAVIDAHLADTEREMRANSIPMSEANPAFWERYQMARAAMVGARCRATTDGSAACAGFRVALQSKHGNFNGQPIR
jgi:uncharacterized protein (DUF433 family)